VKTEDQYLKFVRWSDDDAAYVGYALTYFHGEAHVTVTTRNRHIENFGN
jgi:hypothetical protein